MKPSQKINPSISSSKSKFKLPKLTRRKIFILGSLAVMLIALPAAIYLVKQRQGEFETRREAKQETTTPESELEELLTPENIGQKEFEKYEVEGKINKNEMQAYEIGDKFVYSHQRKVGKAIVEKDFLNYQFDKETGELLKKTQSWREDISEVLPGNLLSKESAEEAALKESAGKVLFSELYIISPDSDVFPLDPTPENPCWVVRTEESLGQSIIIIDAVTGKYLGNGIMPPSQPYQGFSLSGPQIATPPCSGTWTTWYQNAVSWFEQLGYSTTTSVWPDDTEIQNAVQDPTTLVFYEVAHGSPYGFTSDCGGKQDNSGYTSPNNVTEWMSNRVKMQFTFLASCKGLCGSHIGTLSNAFSKNSSINSTTVGYCGMDTDQCSTCWPMTVDWQDALFSYINQGYTVKDAYEQALSDYPACSPSGYEPCMRFTGDEDFVLTPPATLQECTPEGSTFDIDPSIHNGCCGFLFEGDIYADDDCSASPIPDQKVCINCGDLVCGPGENKCNCSYDCPDIPNNDPVAAITFIQPSARTAASGTVSTLFKVDASASSDPDGDDLTYTWDWGDGSPTSSDVSASHYYLQEGSYTIALQVDDQNGGISSTSKRVSVMCDFYCEIYCEYGSVPGSCGCECLSSPSTTTTPTPQLPSDLDGDGLNNDKEKQLDTNPLNVDTDSDMISDTIEIGDNPDNPLDTDLDGTIDALDTDSDNDSIEDWFEGVVDTDGDATYNFRDLDSDSDQKSDKDEGTDDDDNDMVANYIDKEDNTPQAEVNKDSDNDGLTDQEEAALATGPDDTDSDDDGVVDGAEDEPEKDNDYDGIINVLDEDSDGDGTKDGDEKTEETEKQEEAEEKTTLDNLKDQITSPWVFVPIAVIVVCAGIIIYYFVNRSKQGVPEAKRRGGSSTLTTTR